MIDSNIPNSTKTETNPETSHFIKKIIQDYQLAHPGAEIVLRFPPEPNGYLHIGHAKSICLNFGMALEFQGRCHLRFDDTNPEKENQEYVDAIKDMVQWLGFSWHSKATDASHLYYASDYFEQLYQMATALIQHGYAYVDSQDAEMIKKNRGTLMNAGLNSIYRNRPIEESLALFAQMRAGEHAEGTHVLRAKIDMASGNINLRDPIMYRIRYAQHHRTGNAWCIYPMYDYTHCVSDAIEGITHSICTLEFEDHKPLYDWFLENLQNIGYFPNQILPKQYEFARLNMYYMLTSKRKLLQLVNDHHVNGWDDPRLPTLAGLRRKGYTPDSLRLFCERIGVAKSDSWIEPFVLEQALRDDLDEKANRCVAVLRPIELIIENFDDNHIEWCSAPLHPHHPERGVRTFALTKHLWVEAEDVMSIPSKGFFRLFVGNKVRLRYGFVVECTKIEVDEDTQAIKKVYVQYFADSKSGTEGSNNYKVKGNIHWVSADARYNHSVAVNVYQHLFLNAQPNALKAINIHLQDVDATPSLAEINTNMNTNEMTLTSQINPNSHICLNGFLEKNIDQVAAFTKNAPLQFERHGYFSIDVDVDVDVDVNIDMGENIQNKPHKNQGYDVACESKLNSNTDLHTQHALKTESLADFQGYVFNQITALKDGKK